MVLKGFHHIENCEGKVAWYGPALHGAGLISSPRFLNRRQVILLLLFRLGHWLQA